MKTPVRNAEVVLKQLSDVSGKPVIAKNNIAIQVPVRFKEIGLAQIGSSTFVFGLFAMILDSGEYALMNVNAYLELGAASVDTEEIDGTEYYNFHFEPGDVVFKTKSLVCRPALIFKAISEFVFKGKVPWYVDYDDMGKLFSTAKKHAATTADIRPEVMEFMAAYIGRNKNDRINYIRESAETYADFEKNLAWVPMQSVYWSAPGTVNKLAGAYFQDGIVSAIVNPSERVEKIESILRA